MKLCVQTKRKMGCKQVKVFYQLLSKHYFHRSSSTEWPQWTSKTWHLPSCTKAGSTQQRRQCEYTPPMHIPCSDHRFKAVSEVHIRKL